ncbi:MAG: putative glycoside hydrolase [Actinomycetota bacterium]
MSARSIIAAIAFVAAVAAGAASAPAAAEDVGSPLSIRVTDTAGTAIAGATVEIEGEAVQTDPHGRARIAIAPPGPVLVLHPNYEAVSFEWTGNGDRVHVSLGSDAVRALHVGGHIPGTPRWDALLDLADRTALNAVMLDMKDESGTVWPSVGALSPAALERWSIREIAAELDERGLDLILRVVAFQDPQRAAVQPGSAVVDIRTGGPFERNGQVFLDPSDESAQAYVRALTEFACAEGADEVQLDYIRFPDGITPNLRFDNADGMDEASRTATITSYVAGLHEDLDGRCRLAADIFGFVTSVQTDGGIGQQLEAIAAVTDVLSPMVYPNHWSSGWFGFPSPAANPGGVVTASMRNAVDRVGAQVMLRPWLQDFGGYGIAEVRAQIDAADELGLGWMIWNARSEFTEAAIPTDAEVQTPSTAPEPTVEVLPPSGFWDVPKSSSFSADVAWLGAEGITRGCNPPWRDDFCPKRGVTRAEAAALLVRALDLAPGSRDYFVDDTGSTHENDINALAEAGITRGCTATSFCPDRVLTREQMASLLARALDLPRSVGDSFVDDDTSTHRFDIERIAAVGITRGCAPQLFCPRDPVTRDQLAAFLFRSLS